MLFAHAPAGFLVTYFTRKIWAKNLTPKQIIVFYILGAFFGIFPDIDVFYYYLFSAISPHREFFTHSFIFYLFTSLILLFLAWFLKRKILNTLSIVFIFSTFSHLILDSLGYGIMWLYPFSNSTFGLLMVKSISESFFGQKFLFFNLIFEAIIILAAINLLVLNFLKKYFKVTFFASYFAFLLIIFLLYNAFPYLYSGPIRFYYQDQDKDKILNFKDRDLDGDGILNIEDFDANNDGKSNITQIVETAKKMENVRYDKSNGNFFEIFLRLGYVAKTDVVLIPYNSAGIFFKEELQEDFNHYPFRYEGNPRHSHFVYNPYNLFIFFRNYGMLKDGKYFKEGDIVFFGEKVENVALVLEGNKKNRVIRLLAPERGKMKFLSLAEAYEKYGKVVAVGRLKWRKNAKR